MPQKVILIAITASMGLAGCNSTTGGSGGFSSSGGTDILTRYNNLSTIDTTEFTPNATVATMNGTARYSGVGNFTNGTGVFSAYLGAIDLDVEFASGDMTGSVTDFAEYVFSLTGYTLGTDINGSLALTGTLAADNQSLTDGFAGRAVGSLDGVDLAMDMDGNLLGSNGDGMVLYFTDDVIFGAGGVGFAAQ